MHEYVKIPQPHTVNPTALATTLSRVQGASSLAEYRARRLGHLQLSQSGHKRWMATSAYSVDAANPGRSRLEALATLGASPLEPNALFKLCEACVLLGRNTEAVAALSAGAAHHPHLSDFFHKRARSLGAWRLPPPLLIESDANRCRSVARLNNPTREAFAVYVQKREPVIVSGLAVGRDWNWETLIRHAHNTPSADSGDVTLSATGCVPDYGSSSFEAVRQSKLRLSEILTRVSAPAGRAAIPPPPPPPAAADKRPPPPPPPPPPSSHFAFDSDGVHHETREPLPHLDPIDIDPFGGTTKWRTNTKRSVVKAPCTTTVAAMERGYSQTKREHGGTGTGAAAATSGTCTCLF